MGSQRSIKITIMLIFIFTFGFSLTSCFMFFMDWEGATDTIVYLIDENFDDSVADNWTPDASGWWSVADFEYVLFPNPGTGTFISYYNETGNNSFTDFVFEAAVIQETGSVATSHEFGLFFRVTDIVIATFTGYRLVIEMSNAPSANWALVRWDGGLPTPLLPFTSNPNLSGIHGGIGGTYNRIKVECRGDNIDIYFNDVFIQSVTDSTYSAGFVGLIGEDTAFFNNFSFDNVRLW